MIVDLVCVGLLLGFALAIAWPRWNRNIDWGDEGFLAYGAVRVMHGELPHRDFVSLQPPLSFYSVALAFKIFGTSLLTLRGFGLSIFLLLVLLIYALTRCLTKPVLALAAAAPAAILSLPYFFFVPFAVWQGITASLCAVLFFLHALARNRLGLAGLAGFFSALSLLARHDQAFYVTIALLFFSILSVWASEDFSLGRIARLVLSWLGVMMLVVAPLFIWWWRAGALPEMWRQLVLFPLTTYAKTSYKPWPKFTPDATLAETATVLLFYLSPCLMAAAAVWLGQRIARGRFAMREALFGFFLLWSALFFLQALVRSDFSHLLVTLPPFFVLAASCWQIFLRALGERGAWRIICSSFVAALVIGLLWLVRPVVLPPPPRSLELLNLKAGGIYVENGRWLTDFIEGIQRYVPADRPILALPYQPMSYFLCQRHNPTRWNYIWPGDQTPQEHVDLIMQAKRDQPAVALITDEENLARFAPEIVDYIHLDFRYAGDIYNMSIYFPNEPTP